jgi:[ribosomal protein S5]-alanine N-acetyltransferase
MMAEFDFETFPILETERLVLRGITRDDIPALRGIYGDTEVMRYMADMQSTLSTDRELRSIVDWAGRMFAGKNGIRWGIVPRGEGDLIGTCGFHLLDWHNQHAEIGYDLARAYWRKGIMTEAVRAIVRFGFERLNLHRIEANVTEGNEASAKTLLKAGFQQEGVWRERAYLRGAFYDLLQFGLLKSEFDE